MEELKNENVAEQSTVEEPVVEQRPSTKYGRTAFQQSEERPYQQYQQSNWQNESQYNTYAPYEEPKPAVKSIFAHALMVLMALSMIIDFIANVMSSRAYGMGDTLDEIVEATLMIAQEPTMVVLSAISNVLLWVTIVLLILDIIQLHKAGKKITGAILFAIFLRPAYFIWRAHLLSQKKVGPIIYAVVIYLISFVQYVVLLTASSEWIMRTMM